HHTLMNDTSSWHHVVIVYDKMTGKAIQYFDGTFKGDVTVSYVDNQNLGIYIGNSLGCSAAGYFKGYIDEVAVYDKAITSTQIDSLYHIGSWPILNSPPIISTDSASMTPTATVGSAYTDTVKATDANSDPITFTFIDSVAGMSLTSAGVLTWTPVSDDVGAKHVSVRSSDGTGGADTVSWTITVSPDPVGLKAYYPFIGNANDISGNGNNGTVSGATLTADRFGASNNAYFINTGSNYIDMGTGIPKDSTYSINFWINTSQWVTSKYIIYYSSSGWHGWVVLTEFDSLKLKHYNGVNNSVDLSYPLSNINQNQWHMVSFTMSPSSRKMYVDNILVAQQSSYSKLDVVQTVPLSVGEKTSSANLPMKFDDFGYWSKVVLTAAQIDSLYKLGGYPGTAASVPNITTEPTAQSKTVGESVTFTVVASGIPAPTYQWRKDGTDISGATSSSYTIATIALADTGRYSVIVTNNQGSDTSSAVQLTVNPVSGLVAYYPFTGNANDVSGNGYNGTVSGATLSSDRFGNSNSAYKFNGSNYIDIGNSVLATNSDFSISLWYKG
ncbi:MAG: immunoglobulin domain-containing protein, partial [Fibrobacteres bacterium]|nr:immunoglobulin domain-containing protein [Fibrobacterota bacterium]